MYEILFLSPSISLSLSPSISFSLKLKLVFNGCFLFRFTRCDGTAKTLCKNRFFGIKSSRNNVETSYPTPPIIGSFGNFYIYTFSHLLGSHHFDLVIVSFTYLNNFNFFIISLAEKRTVCLQEVNELKETDSIQFLNEIDQIAPCKATLALTGKAEYDRLTILHGEVYLNHAEALLSFLTSTKTQQAKTCSNPTNICMFKVNIRNSGKS